MLAAINSPLSAKQFAGRDRSADGSSDKAVSFVRGGAVCHPDQALGARILETSRRPAVCKASIGGDGRHRWNTAN